MASTLRRVGVANLSAPARLACVALGGYLFGFVTAHIPSPTDPSYFWVSNLAAPYLLIPFLAGAWHFRPWWAAGAGALAAAATVTGFYGLLTVGDTSSTELGLPAGTDRVTLAAHAYGNWFRHLALGQPGGVPWLTLAVLGGAGFGYLGHLWCARGSRIAATVVVLAFTLEPIVYLSHIPLRRVANDYGLDASNAAIWGAEMLFGLAALAFVWAVPRGPRPAR